MDLKNEKKSQHRQIRRWCFALPLATVFFCILISAGYCSESELVSVPKLPEFQADRDKNGKPLYIDVGRIEKQFRATSPAMKKFYYNHDLNSIILPTREWLKQALDVSQEFFWTLGVKWKAENWDCDNFSMFFSAAVTVKLWGVGYTETRCGFGWMLVDGKHSWGGVEPSRHALVFAVTREGVIVIEPQTGTMAKLDDYPNKENIEKVFLL